MKAPVPLTSRDLAREAGVSQSTVSRALRDDVHLPKATCLRIQALAAKLGYRANPIVAHLTSELRRSRGARYQATLAFVHDFPNRDWSQCGAWSFTLPGLRARANELGYEVEEFGLRQLGVSGRRLTSVLQARGIRGVFVAPLPKPVGHLSLDWTGFCALTLGYQMPKPRLHAIGSDHYFDMSLALRRLVRLGYKRIGLFFDHAADLYSGGQYSARFLGYMRAQPARNQVPILWLENWDTAVVQKSLGKWLDQYRPDAVVAMSPQSLAGLREFGDVPGEIGFAALDMPEGFSGCSGIWSHPVECMAASVDFVVSQLYLNRIGVPRIPFFLRLEGEWIDGGSTRKRRAI
ncbi:MAG: LacI family DNA-binding transcriptional regulator [Terrimicrobiaceae bacterium]